MPQKKQRLPVGERRRQVLDAFRDLTAQHGYPPSRQEVADAVGLASTSTVQWHLDRLEADGLIRIRRRTPKPKKTGAIEVVTGRTKEGATAA